MTQQAQGTVCSGEHMVREAGVHSAVEHTQVNHTELGSLASLYYFMTSFSVPYRQLNLTPILKTSPLRCGSTGGSQFVSLSGFTYLRNKHGTVKLSHVLSLGTFS